MLFSSMTFLFVYMPFVCGVYILSKPELRNYILLLASIIFYAWGEPRYLTIMIVTILVNYIGAILLDKCYANKRLILVATVAMDLSLLIYFKYFNFAIENFNRIFSTNIDFIHVVMPIGISFYTFQAMSYLVDVYRGEVKAQRDIYKLALYISLFPQLIAGPIVKYKDIENYINNRQVSFDKVSFGIKRFIIGLSKKILIANTLGELADKIFSMSAQNISVADAWLGAVSYSLQLYYDFSGYSDMSIGLGLVFGFRFLENFNYPYVSKSITEFWRRWHISLSSWFKEYVYIPLGGNRCSKNRMYTNLFVVFIATGIWHGASWSFVIWGLWHGFLIVVEKITSLYGRALNVWGNVLLHMYTIIAFVVGWVIFRSDNLLYAYSYLRSMIGCGLSQSNEFIFVTNIQIACLLVGVLCSMPIFRNVLNISYDRKILRTLVNICLFCLFALSSASIAASTYNPFIYFRF